MKYKLVIFDLDGTVLDTLNDLASSVNFALSENFLPKRGVEEVRAFVGNGIRLLIERAVPENTDTAVTDAVFETFKRHYKEHSSDTTKVYDGVDELLSELKRKGIKTAVVSNKADFAVKDLVKKYFGSKFDFAVGERDGIAKKPAPDSVLEAIETLGLKTKETLYVGDSEVDIITAENAGVDCIAVNWGFRDENVLKNSGAKIIVSNTAQLAECILHI